MRSVILNEKSKEKNWSLSVCYIKIELETLQVENIADLQSLQCEYAIACGLLSN